MAIYEVTFHLKRPQPSLLALLASGWSPVYPCHVSPRDMRTHPIGTGPFKFVEFKPNESIKVARNPDYWKPGRPYLDGIEYTIHAQPGDRDPGLHRRQVRRDLAGHVSIPLMKEVKSQEPKAICEVVPWNIQPQMIVNRSKPPFDNADLRRAMALSLDRQRLYRHSERGAGRDRRRDDAAAGGHLGHAAGGVADPPGLRPGCRQEPRRGARDHEEARLRAGQAARGDACRRATPRPIAMPAVLLIDQLKEIYIDGDARTDRHDAMVSRPSCARTTPSAVYRQRERARRPRPAVLREFLLRCRAQLHRLLQCRGRQADRPAIERARYRQTQTDRLGDRAQAGGGRGPSGALLSDVGGLLAALVQGADDDGQQQVQRLAHGGRLARQIDGRRLAARKTEGETSMKRHLRTMRSGTGLLLARGRCAAGIRAKAGRRSQKCT